MSVYCKDLFGRSKYDQAIERIKSYCTGKKVLVAFSGGKDSQCCYHLCKDACIEFSAQYSITRFEPPEVISFIRSHYPDVTFRRAYKRSLIEDIEEKGLPNRWYRWCCDAKHRKTDGFDISVIGVRSDESPRRSSNWRMFGQKRDRTFYLCPIIDWTDSDVWEYLRSRNIPHCSLYDEGFRRIGCVCCPLSPSKMRSDATRWPKTAAMLFVGHLKNWEKAIRMCGKTISGKSFRMLDHGSARGAFEHWLNSGMTIKCDDILGDEPCLFAGTGFSESDGGNY